MSTDVGWPFVVLTIALLLRDEFRWWYNTKRSIVVRQTDEQSPAPVRAGDSPAAAAVGVARRRSTDDQSGPQDPPADNAR